MFIVRILLAYGVPLVHCFNIYPKGGLAFCSNPTCKIVLGSYDSVKDALHLTQVREVFFWPLGSYVRGQHLHNVNTFRMMYMEMLEKTSTFGPRHNLDISQHIVEPIESVSICEENIYQAGSPPLDGKGSGVSSTLSVSHKNAGVRVRDFGSYQLFGKNKDPLGRLVVNKNDVCVPVETPLFDGVVGQTGCENVAVLSSPSTASFTHNHAGKNLFCRNRSTYQYLSLSLKLNCGTL